MYRVDAGADDQPYMVWSVPYDTIGKCQTGAVRARLRHHPDDPRRRQVRRHHRQRRADERRRVPDRGTDWRPTKQVVCKVPVFDFPGGGDGANSNSLIGSHNSIIVQNTYDYLFDWDDRDVDEPRAHRGSNASTSTRTGRAAPRSGSTRKSPPTFARSCRHAPG